MGRVRALSHLATHRSVATQAQRRTAPRPPSRPTDGRRGTPMTITGSPGVRTARRPRGRRAGAAVLAAGLLAAAALVVPATTAQAEPVLLSQGLTAPDAYSVTSDYTHTCAAAGVPSA